MKILIVSMRSLHAVRWVSQLKDSSHEVHYFDILNGGFIKEWNWVHQHTNWRYKFGDFKGRTFIKKYLPLLHKLYENNIEKEFERLLKQIKPDVVHSFVLYKCCVPILPIMKKYPNIKWMYSAWGNDLFYYRNLPIYKKDILKVLPHIDYMFADCKRDIVIAKEMGFNGKELGVFPGGGGYHLKEYESYIQDINDRKTILIKGYEQRFGKCSIVLQAMSQILNTLEQYSIVVFGADKELKQYLRKNPIHKRIEVLETLTHNDVLKLMGKSLIYIGNSISDGMPNTLLEALIMGAFPIQSNPGGATEEIIKHNHNGLLIQNPLDKDEIANWTIKAIQDKDMLQNAFEHNQQMKHNLEYNFIKNKVVEVYKQVENQLN